MHPFDGQNGSTGYGNWQSYGNCICCDDSTLHVVISRFFLAPHVVARFEAVRKRLGFASVRYLDAYEILSKRNLQNFRKRAVHGKMPSNALNSKQFLAASLTWLNYRMMILSSMINSAQVLEFRLYGFDIQKNRIITLFRVIMLSVSESLVGSFLSS